MRKIKDFKFIVIFFFFFAVATIPSSVTAKNLNDYNVEGAQAYNAGRYQKAIEIWSIGLERAKKQKNEKWTGYFLGNLSTVYFSLGQYDKSLKYDKQTLALSKKIKDAYLECNTLNNIGTNYKHFGQYEKAIEHYRRSLAISRKFKNPKKRAIERHALSNLGVIYTLLGQFDKALIYQEQALAIERKFGDKKGEASSLSSISNVYRHLGKYEKALEYSRQSLVLRKKIGDVHGEIKSLNLIGVLYKALHQFENARNYFEKALSLKKKTGIVDGQEAILHNLGNLYGIAGQYEMASQYFEEALAIIRKTGDIEGEGRTLSRLGLAYLSTGKLKKAEKQLSSSVRIFESIRGKIRSGTERTGFQSISDDPYMMLAGTQIALRKTEKAFETIERRRAKSFLDLLGTRETASKSKEADQIFELENQLASLRNDRIKLASDPKGLKKRAQQAALDDEILKKDKRRNELIKKMRQKDPEFGSLICVSPPNSKEIQSLLSSGTALIEYFHGGEYVISGKKYNRLWIFILDNKRIYFKGIDVSYEDLTKSLEEYANLIAEGALDLKKLNNLNNKLYEWMIQPLDSVHDIAKKHTLIFVPWGPMFKIPFATLSPKNGNPIVASKNIVMSPSAGIYQFLSKKQKSGRKKIFAIGVEFLFILT